MTANELRQKFVKKASSFVGIKEGSTKHKYIVDTYNKIVPLPAGYKVKYTDHWCATFVSAIASLCDLLDIIPAECSCNRMIALAKDMGIWVENDAYAPNVGDIILYDWEDSGSGDNKGSSDHVGIITEVNSGKITVIEGNKANAVGYRTIAINGKYIRGFIAPDFSRKTVKQDIKQEMCAIELPVLKKGIKSDHVRALQILLVGYGYSVGKTGVDGSFGSNTLKAVKQFQKDKQIKVDGSVGPITWKSLLG